MKQPKVSVIITTYNRDEYILETVNSILSQDYEDFELIIVDDGSTDDTRDKIKLIEDSRMKYFYKRNGGQNSARNFGLHVALGEYVSFIDSDDLWHQEKLSSHVAILDERKDISVVYSGTALINEYSSTIGKKQILNYSGMVLDKMLMKNFLYNGSNAVFRKSCIEKTGYFDESIKRMTDWEFYLRLALYFKFHCVNKYLLLYRVHSFNMSQDYKSYKKNSFKILAKIFKNKDMPREYKLLRMQAISRRYKYLAFRYLQNMYTVEARKYFHKAILSDLMVALNPYILINYLLTFVPINWIPEINNFKNSLKNMLFKFAG